MRCSVLPENGSVCSVGVDNDLTDAGGDHAEGDGDHVIT